MNEQECLYVSIDSKADYYSFVLSLRQWNQLKKKVEREFRDPHDFSEVRFHLDEKNEQIDFEGHCCLKRKRNE